MTQRIYKTTLTTISTCELPLNAELLTVQMQHSQPQLWFLFNTNTIETEVRTFETFGTGHDIHNDKYDYEYINTFQMSDGMLVFHVFERFPKITAANVKLVREALDINGTEAKSLLEEHKGRIEEVLKKFGITKSFEEFQATREEGIIPTEVLGSEVPTNGYLYLHKQCAIIIIEEGKYELILGNEDTVSNNLKELEMKLYKWAMDEGY